MASPDWQTAAIAIVATLIIVWVLNNNDLWSHMDVSTGGAKYLSPALRGASFDRMAYEGFTDHMSHIPQRAPTKKVMVSPEYMTRAGYSGFNGGSRLDPHLLIPAGSNIGAGQLMRDTFDRTHMAHATGNKGGLVTGAGNFVTPGTVLTHAQMQAGRK